MSGPGQVDVDYMSLHLHGFHGSPNVDANHFLTKMNVTRQRWIECVFDDCDRSMPTPLKYCDHLRAMHDLDIEVKTFNFNTSEGESKQCLLCHAE